MNADITFHFAIGMLAGSAIGARRVAMRWAENRKLAGAFFWWFAWCYGAAVFAVAPNIFRYFGLPEPFCSGWWMNVFLFHPLIDRWLPQGKIVGGSIIITVAVTQYFLLLLAIRRARGVLNSEC